MMAQLRLGRDAWLLIKRNSTENQDFATTMKLFSRANSLVTIFAANDLSPFGVIAAIREAGLGVSPSYIAD